MNTHFYPPGADRVSPPHILILGEPGTGKTRLAATFPSPLFIDTEPDGAASALPEPPARIFVPVSAIMLKDIQNHIISLKKKPFNDGAYDFDGLPVRTLVIDSLDQVQRAVQTFEILKGRTKMQMQDWGVLLEKMYPLVLEWSSLPINVVVVGHTKRVLKEDGGMSENTLAVRGALKDELPGWFSMILHVTSGVEGQRSLVTQPMISRGVRYTAKDRHNVLGPLTGKNKFIDITSETGWPNNRVAEVICGTVPATDG